MATLLGSTREQQLSEGEGEIEQTVVSFENTGALVTEGLAKGGLQTTSGDDDVRTAWNLSLGCAHDPQVRGGLGRFDQLVA